MWGGRRIGSGRKPSEPTKVVRVPVRLVEDIKAFVSGDFQNNLTNHSLVAENAHLKVSLQQVTSDLQRALERIALLEREKLNYLQLKCNEINDIELDEDECFSGDTIKTVSSSRASSGLNSFQKVEFSKLSRLSESEKSKICKEYKSLPNAVVAGVRCSGNTFKRPK
jgi:hypothetical protein